MLYNKYSAWVRPLNNGYNPYTKQQLDVAEKLIQDQYIRKALAMSMLNDGIASNDTAAILIGLTR